MERRSLNRLIQLLLSPDPRQQIRLAQCGMALLLNLASGLVIGYFVLEGTAPRVPAAWLVATGIAVYGGCFAFMRSGQNLRFADPSLTAPQILFGLLYSVAAYAICGAGRGAVFPMLMVVLVFGMFELPPAAMRRFGLMALVLFGGAMSALAWLRPEVYVPSVELGHVLILAISLPVFARLAGELSRLREKLRQQKAELTEALGRIQDLATRDDLTGLANRRHVQQLVDLERTRGVRSGHVFCVAMIDIDHFKRINDTHGHPVGDRVLRNFAREALATIRGSDVLGRWGGEEFLMMLPDTRVALAKLGVERLRQRAEAMRIDADGAVISFTLSAGVVEHLAGEPVADTIARADRALYLAKQQGRNCVVVA